MHILLASGMCSEVENAENKHILYVCNDCYKAKKSKKKMQKTNCNINNQKLNELKAHFHQIYDLMNNMAQGLYHQIEELAKQVGSNNSLAANCMFWDNHSNGDTSIKFGMHNLLKTSVQKKMLTIPKSKMVAIFQDGCQ